MLQPAIAPSPDPDQAEAADEDPGRRLEAAVSAITRWAARPDVRAEVTRRARCDLPDGTVWLLGRVVECGPVRPSDLATFHKVDASTITPRLQRLERDALVRREADPRDGRVALVRATAAGSRLVARLHAARQAMLEETVRDWSPRRVGEVADAVAGLADRLRR